MEKRIVEIVLKEIEGKENIVYTYQDKQNKTSTEKHPVLLDDERRKYIKKEIPRYGITQLRPQTQKFYIVENAPTDPSQDYSYHIFLCKIDFAEKTFSYGANFYCAEFSKKANFREAKFSKEANFRVAKFSKEANFALAQFFGEVNFRYAEFSGEAYFFCAKFFANAFFLCAKFFANTFFWGVKFSQEADFEHAQFSKDACFNHTRFSGEACFSGFTTKQELNFSYSTFKEILNISSLEPSKKSKLNLVGAGIESINYTNRNIAAKDRRTFTALKNIAIKQNDQISALTFYIQEMETYYKELSQKKELSWKKEVPFWSNLWNNFCRFIGFIFEFFLINHLLKIGNLLRVDKLLNLRTDKAILYLEKNISHFGTNPLPSFLWFLRWNAFFIFGVYFWWFCVPLGDAFYSLWFRQFAEGFHWGLSLAHLIQILGNVFLIYELLKSLRKFSRKL